MNRSPPEKETVSEDLWTDYKASTRNISKYETTSASDEQKRWDENAEAAGAGTLRGAPEKTYRGDKTASADEKKGAVQCSLSLFFARKELKVKR